MAEVSTGVSITFATGFMAEILNASWSGMSRPSIKTSHHGSTDWDSFVPGELTDPGQLAVELQFDPDATPPFNDAPEAVTLTFPGGDTWGAQGFLQEFEFATPLEDKMTATATLKLTDAITVTPGP